MYDEVSKQLGVHRDTGSGNEVKPNSGVINKSVISASFVNCFIDLLTVFDGIAYSQFRSRKLVEM